MHRSESFFVSQHHLGADWGQTSGWRGIRVDCRLNDNLNDNHAGVDPVT